MRRRLCSYLRSPGEKRTGQSPRASAGIIGVGRCNHESQREFPLGRIIPTGFTTQGMAPDRAPRHASIPLHIASPSLLPAFALRMLPLFPPIPAQSLQPPQSGNLTNRLRQTAPNTRGSPNRKTIRLSLIPFSLRPILLPHAPFPSFRRTTQTPTDAKRNPAVTNTPNFPRLPHIDFETLGLIGPGRIVTRATLKKFQPQSAIISPQQLLVSRDNPN